MLSLFTFLKGVLRPRETVIDNAVFALHYKWSVTILLIFSALVTWKQNWGNPIQCISDHKCKSIVETFCWNEGTFSIPTTWNLTVGVQVPYPGISNAKKDPSDRKYHAYYQWVGLTLFLQAVMFCIPRYTWRCEEAGFMSSLTLGLNSIGSSKMQDEKVKQVIGYLRDTRRHHKYYVYLYIACEMGNFVNVVFQMYFINLFMGGEFVRFSLHTLRLSTDKYNYLGYRVFPKMTKCLFHDFGSSGDIQNFDAFCLLSLNILHEKVFAFLFLWFFLVALASAMLLLHRSFTFFSYQVRVRTLSIKASLCSRTFLRELCEKLSFDDWLLLYMISKNTSPVCFRDIIYGVSAKNPNLDDEITYL